MGKLKVAVLISGSGTNLQALIDASHMPDYPAEIIAVISNKQGAYGLTRAKAAGIPTFFIDPSNFAGRDRFDEAVHETLVEVGAEFVCLAGFMRIITSEFVEKWQGKMINIHPSLLPSFKGLHAQQQALDAGVKLSGCTVHYVTAEMDSGPIIVQAAVPVYAEDSEVDLQARILAVEHRCYPLALKLVAEGKAKLEGDKVSIAGNRLAGEYVINPVEG